jgi:DNA-binding MarR family transcriptional regulator
VENEGVSEAAAAETATDVQVDLVDRRLEVCARELPELDLATEGIVQRIQVLDKRFEHSMNETLARFGVSWGEWKLLGALRLGGPPYRSTPGRLAEWLHLSSGAMTNRLDRMEESGLVRRLPDPDDRRSVGVELTDAGTALYLETVGIQAGKEALVAAALDDDEKAQLNALLRRLLLALEQLEGPLPKTRHKRDD